MKRICVRKLALGLAILLSLWSFVFAEVALAGDTDGVAGYSMRLKNKDYDGSDSGSGGSQLTIVVADKSSSTPSVQLAANQGLLFENQVLLAIRWVAYFFVK